MDNPFDGSSGTNPFSGSGAPSVATGDEPGMATPDPQMMNSQTPPMGGDALPTQQTDPVEQGGPVTSSIRQVLCLTCGHEGALPVRQITASLQCRCGSSNIVVEADEGEEDWSHDASIQFSSGVVGYVRPQHDPEHPDRWHWVLEKDGNKLASGWAYNELQAKSIVENQEQFYSPYFMDLAPETANPHVHAVGQPHDHFSPRPVWKTAEFPPKKDDDDKKKDDDKKSDDGPPKDGPPAGPAPAAPHPAAGTPVPAAPAAGGPPAPGEGVDPTQDPNAAQDPTQMGADPMDQAQAIVDQAVEQIKGLGHDAKEVSYDVDQLFSKWRCMGCELEGQADVAEDGTAQLSGDLFEQGLPCATPAPPDPTDQAPQAPPPAPLPGGAPAGQQQPQTPQQQPTASKKHWWQRKADKELNEERPEENAPPEGDTEEKIAAMAEHILETNPGLSISTAMKVARQTLSTFPSVGK